MNLHKQAAKFTNKGRSKITLSTQIAEQVRPSPANANKGSFTFALLLLRTLQPNKT